MRRGVHVRQAMHGQARGSSCPRRRCPNTKQGQCQGWRQVGEGSHEGWSSSCCCRRCGRTCGPVANSGTKKSGLFAHPVVVAHSRLVKKAGRHPSKQKSSRHQTLISSHASSPTSAASSPAVAAVASESVAAVAAFLASRLSFLTAFLAASLAALSAARAAASCGVDQAWEIAIDCAWHRLASDATCCGIVSIARLSAALQLVVSCQQRWIPRCVALIG